MNNQLLKNQSRYLYTEYGQQYYPAVPARPGYWWVASAPQWAWVPVKTVYGRPLMGHWSITMYWFDPYQRKNMEWYGQASEGQEIRAPYITRGAGSREEIQIRAPDQKTQIWEPPTPAIPEQPFIPDRHVYEDNSGWDAGARAVRAVAQHGLIHWSMSATARGVVVGLARTPAAGAYWQYLVGVRAEEGVAKVVLAGVDVVHLGRFANTTKFKIAYTDAAFEVYVDNVLRHSVPVSGDGAALLFDVSLYSAGDYIFNPAITAHHIGSVQGQFQLLQGMATDELLDGVVLLNAPYLQGSALGEGQANDAASGSLGHLLGLATDLDELAFTTGQLPALQGQASGYRDLLPQEEPSNIYAGFARITALGAVTDTGVQQLAAPYLQGLASDEADVSVAFGYLPSLSLLIEEEDPNEDELWQRVKWRGRFQPHGVQDIALVQRVVQRWAIGQTGLSAGDWAERAKVLAGWGLSQISGAVLHAVGRLPSGEGNRLPADDEGVSVLTCHEGGGYVTQYTAYNFQSFATINGACYGVAADGVYLLEGDSDDGRECVASVDLGTKDFGSSDMTSLSAAYAGIASAAQAVLTVQTRQGAFQYHQRASHPRLQQQRFDVGRGMRDTHYDLSIQAPAHGLELADLTFDINNSSRKI